MRMRALFAVIVAVVLLAGMVPASTFGHGGGQDPTLTPPADDSAGGSEQE